MQRATHLLPLKPDYLLVDGKFPVPITIPQQALIKGETRSASIAAASIIAKVTRDELMQKLHLKFPVYNFHKHKGYPTVMHRRAIRDHGPCEIHRKTFKGVREYISRES
jgi:ribonuclease HII